MFLYLLKIPCVDNKKLCKKRLAKIVDKIINILIKLNITNKL